MILSKSTEINITITISKPMTTKISLTFTKTTTLLEVVIKAFIGKEISQSDHNNNSFIKFQL